VGAARISLAAFVVFLATSSLEAAPARLVLPAAASVHGANGTFFHTDLRVMNLSFAASADVQAVYHCRGGGACASVAATFRVASRQNLALNDVVVSLFGANETGGAIEFFYDDAGGPLFVSSRLYTPEAPFLTYGASLKALRLDEASTRCLFNQVALSADLASGFRTNAGGFNPGLAPVTATYTLRRGDGTALGSVSRTVGPSEFFQFDGTIGDASGVSGLTDDGLSLSIVADGLFFPFAVVIDNQSGDLVFVEPVEDIAPPETVALLVTLSRYQFSPGGPDDPIQLRAGTTYRITFRSADVEHGLSSIPQLGIAGRSIAPGSDYVVTVTPTFPQRGRYNFACTRVCGTGHGGMYGAIEVE
jgi:hypothetical protein